MSHAAAPLHQAEPRPQRQLRVIPGFGGGPPPSRTAPPISNAQIGVLVLIAFETMLFAGLLVAYWVLRSGSFVWPPPDMPRLPLAVTGVNSAVLLMSAFTMTRSLTAVRAERTRAFRRALTATGVLGVVFLVVQGSEWARLMQQGLHLSSGPYGATFYTLIGWHAAHVVGAVVWLLVVLALAYRQRYTAREHTGVTICATYWYFVCAVWVVLFPAVYLY